MCHPKYNMRLESLEDRTLLAGDVIANVVQGNLVLRGDADSNGVAIRSGAEPGEYVIVGLPTAGGDTSINGVFDAAIVSGVRRGIRVGLDGGDDTFRLSNAYVRGSVDVHTGVGNDDVTIGGPLSDSGRANTGIRVLLNVGLGAGDDSLEVLNSRVRHQTWVAAGSGEDSVNVRHSDLGRHASIRTGLGDDSVNVGESHAGSLRIDTGMHNDTVRVVDSAFESLGVALDAGDDAMGVFGVTARNAAFYGGRGIDHLNMGHNRFRNLLRVGFEPDRTSDAALDADEDAANKELAVSAPLDGLLV